MDRDPIAEWRRALERREPRRGWRLAETLSPQPFVMAIPPDATGALDLRRTRRLTVPADWRLDFGAAIRVLQRHNKLLRARFGIGWAEVAGLLLGESHRRGVSTENLARVLAAGLRRDQQGQGA